MREGLLLGYVVFPFLPSHTPPLFALLTSACLLRYRTSPYHRRLHDPGRRPDRTLCIFFVLFVFFAASSRLTLVPSRREPVVAERPSTATVSTTRSTLSCASLALAFLRWRTAARIRSSSLFTSPSSRRPSDWSHLHSNSNGSQFFITAFVEFRFYPVAGPY